MSVRQVLALAPADGPFTHVRAPHDQAHCLASDLVRTASPNIDETGSPPQTGRQSSWRPPSESLEQVSASLILFYTDSTHTGTCNRLLYCVSLL